MFFFFGRTLSHRTHCVTKSTRARGNEGNFSLASVAFRKLGSSAKNHLAVSQEPGWMPQQTQSGIVLVHVVALDGQGTTVAALACCVYNSWRQFLAIGITIGLNTTHASPSEKNYAFKKTDSK